MKKLVSLLLTLMTVLSLLPCAALADEPETLRIAGPWYFDTELLDRYTAETGVRFETVEADDIMSEMANAFATRSDRIDLFGLMAYSGLFAVKEHGYYVPLESNATLAAKLDGLYPAIRDALTHDGHMAAWVLTAQPMHFYADTTVLAEVGLTLPETFSELLDACRAIIDADALSSEASLFDMQRYCAEDILGLYVKQYIRASTLEGGVVDFTRPEFAAMAERIRAQVPREDPKAGEEAYDYVFSYDSIYESISANMTPPPQALENQSGAAETLMAVAIVNPSSSRQEAAIDFLAWYACQTNRSSYAYDASLTEPMENPDVVKELQDIAVTLRTLERIEQPTAEQQDQMADLAARQEQLESRRWLITEEDIAYYRAYAKRLYISEDSPVAYDDALRTCVGQFVNGAYDGAAFARACQDHIAMIYREHGIPME